MTARKVSIHATKSRNQGSIQASVAKRQYDEDPDIVALDSSTVNGQQDMQRQLLAQLYQEVGLLEQAIAPITNRSPSLLNSDRISSNNSPSISPVVDELSLRNDAIRSLISDLQIIRESITL